MGSDLETRVIRNAEEPVARQEMLIAAIRANHGDTAAAEAKLAELKASLEELKGTAKIRTQS
jgi:hypothetical protein